MRTRKISEYKHKQMLLGLIKHNRDAMRGLLIWHFGTNNGKLRSGLSPLLIPALQIYRFVRFYAPSSLYQAEDLHAIERTMDFQGRGARS